jgi:antirestriction protein ArdC
MSLSPVVSKQRSRRRRFTAEERAQQCQESLSRAVGNLATSNYAAIFEGFAAMGIAEGDIHPRENVFTLKAWNALGRKVKRGSKGVRVTTWINSERENKETGEKDSHRFATSSYVFHVSQTEPMPEAVKPVEECDCDRCTL